MKFDFKKSLTINGVTIGVLDLNYGIAVKMDAEYNTHNRKIKEKEVQCYARLLGLGKWLPYTVIRITKDGWLSDGQHRIKSVIKSRKTMKDVIVIVGVDPEDQKVIDRGAKRSFSDDLAIEDFCNARTLAAITRKAMDIDNGVNLQTLISANGTGRADVIAPIELDEYFRNNTQEMVWLCKKVKKNSKSNIPSAVLNVVTILFYRIDETMADQFFEKLNSCLFSSKKDPLNVLRARIERIKSDRHSGGGDARTILALTIKAWNAFIRKEEIGVLKWQSEGEGAEKFPKPISPVEVHKREEV